MRLYNKGTIIKANSNDELYIIEDISDRNYTIKRLLYPYGNYLYSKNELDKYFSIMENKVKKIMEAKDGNKDKDEKKLL